MSDYLKKYNPDLYQQSQEDEKKRSFYEDITNSVDSNRGLPEPRGALSSILDLLSRGNYGSAKAFDVLINEEGSILGRSWRGFKEGMSEIISPQERLLFSDVIKRFDPVYGATHPIETEVLGFIGDVVIDPINLFTAGTGGLLRGAVKIVGKGGKIIPLSKPGVKVFERIVQETGTEGLSGIVQRETSEKIMQQLLDPSSVGKVSGATERAKDVELRVLKSRVSKVGESIPDRSGVFLTDIGSINNLREGKGLTGLLSLDEIKELKDGIRSGDEISGALFDSILQGSPKIEVSSLGSSAYLDNIIQYGNKSSRQIGVIVPAKYITKTLERGDKVGISRMFASSTIDPSDLRFVTHDAEKVLDFSGLQNHVINRLQKEAVEEARLVRLSRNVKKSLGELDPAKLIDPGGLKFIGHSVVSTEQFKSFARALHLPEALNAVKDLPGIAQLGTAAKGLRETLGLHGILERHYPEWVRFRRHIETLRHDALDNVEKAYVSMFSVGKGQNRRIISTKEREGITDFFSKVGKETEDRIKQLGVENPSFELGQEIFRDLFSASKLNVDQKSVVVKMQQAWNDTYRLEKEAGYVGSYYVNYSPVRYEAISSTRRYVQLRQWQTGQPIKKAETFTKEKKFESIEQALAAGYQPIRDAGMLYGMRFLEHHAFLRKREWESFIEAAYGSADKVPRLIEQDLVRLGEKYYQPRGGEGARLAVEMFNKVNRIFRKSATIVRPAFAVKQVIGNTFQAFAEMGVSALRVFDPTVMGDAINIISKRGEATFDIVDVFGIKYSAEELTRLIKENPVRKNVAIENVGFSSESDIVKRLTSELYTHKMSKGGGFKDNALRGMEDLFTKGAVTLRIPAYVEDIFRIGTFLSAIKSGTSPKAAIEIVDRALFNYTSGLTHEESLIRKAIIPFYSFQKFGLSLLGKVASTTPGRLAIEAKTVRSFFGVWNKIASNEQLTESERSVLPPYLLEQPNVFEKFDEIDGTITAIFRTFNNMMFLDVVNFLHVNEDGSLNTEETLVKGGLSQIAPFWKVPLELMFKRKFFTDSALDGVYSGRVGDINYDKFIENLGIVSGLHQGAISGILGGFVAQLGKWGPVEEVIKKFIGWEEGTDKSGNRYVRINPYMLHVTTSLLPSLNTVLKVSRDNNTIMDNILYANFGIAPVKLDLKEEGVKRAKSARYEYYEKLSEYRTYLREGRINAADLAREDLQELMDYNMEESQLWLDPNIRGGNRGTLENSSNGGGG